MLHVFKYLTAINTIEATWSHQSRCFFSIASNEFHIGAESLPCNCKIVSTQINTYTLFRRNLLKDGAGSNTHFEYAMFRMYIQLPEYGTDPLMLDPSDDYI